jgi:putative flippase GtrA
MKFIDGTIPRFLATGGLNTAVTYLVYLSLLGVIGYRGAFTVAFVGGVILSYGLNAVFVFGRPLQRRTFLAFSLTYVAQYLLGLLLLSVLIDGLGVPAKVAPILSVLVTASLTYLASRVIFRAGPP